MTRGVERKLGMRNVEEGRGYIHLVGIPLQIIHVVKTRVHQERIQLAGFRAEASDAIAALLRSAEFELEGRLVARVDDAEVVGHCRRKSCIGVMVLWVEWDVSGAWLLQTP